MPGSPAGIRCSKKYCFQKEITGVQFVLDDYPSPMHSRSRYATHDDFARLEDYMLVRLVFSEMTGIIRPDENTIYASGTLGIRHREIILVQKEQITFRKGSILLRACGDEPGDDPFWDGVYPPQPKIETIAAGLKLLKTVGLDFMTVSFLVYNHGTLDSDEKRDELKHTLILSNHFTDADIQHVFK